jgi:hypothetical protein
VPRAEALRHFLHDRSQLIRSGLAVGVIRWRRDNHARPQAAFEKARLALFDDPEEFAPLRSPHGSRRATSGRSASFNKKKKQPLIPKALRRSSGRGGTKPKTQSNQWNSMEGARTPARRPGQNPLANNLSSRITG